MKKVALEWLPTMGQITDMIAEYRKGSMTFADLKAKLVAFEWRDLKWPHMGDDYGDVGFPEESTLEELDAAEIDKLITEEESDELYEAILEAHQGDDND